MSFLAPLFLLAGLAAAAPVLFHLVRNRTREVKPFSSLMFLEETPLRMEQHKRLENPWLLLLRVLVVLLIAFGFARPFLARPQVALSGPGTRTAVLLDVSGSMRREGLWKQACAEAEAVLSKAGPSDEVAVFGFDSEVREVFGFERWREGSPSERVPRVRAALAELQPGWDRTVLDGVLMEAALRVARAGEDRALRLVVISDFQEGAKLDGVQGYQWPPKLQMLLKPVAPRETQNASLQWLRGESLGDAPQVRVTNSPGATVEQFALSWETPGAGSQKKDVYVPAGQSRVVRLPEQGAEVLRLSGDREPFDNRVFRVPFEPRRMRVLSAGLPPDDGPRSLAYFLKRAFPKTPAAEVEVADPAVAGWAGADLLVLGENASPDHVEAARAFATKGRMILVPAESERVATVLGALLGRVGATEARGADYALLAGIDYRHPLFLPFADPRFSDFTKMHFWRHRRLDFSGVENVEVLARFDDGSPAVAQARLGAGAVVVLGSSWSPQDGQFALSSKFVPWMNALLEVSSGRAEGPKLAVCGDRLPVPAGADSVRFPDGRVEPVEKGGFFAGTREPGVYEMQPVGQKIAVNMAGEESRTQPVSMDRLQSLGLPLAAREETGGGSARDLEAVQVEGRQKLWRWLVVFALGCVGVETAVSAVVSGRKMKEGVS